MRQVARRRDRGDDLGDEAGNHLPVEGTGDGDPMMAVADEMQLPDAVQIDRRERLPAPGCCGEPLEALPGLAARRPEVAVEAADPVGRADDRVEGDRLQAQRDDLARTERGDHLVVRQQQVDVTRATR